ncbi:MAG: tetratricopeptide repeat protein [Candidatus Hydrogenedentes bacterium]|nr:tetratricopeptide repeat protein [Candidatus Hydrogenedentota bacterium]
MDFFEAQDRFELADDLYRNGQYAQALDQLSDLEKHYPDNYRLLNAKARTLAKLGKVQQALVICDRLLDEFKYEKVRRLRDQLAVAVDMTAKKGKLAPLEPPPLPKRNPEPQTADDQPPPLPMMPSVPDAIPTAAPPMPAQTIEPGLFEVKEEPAMRSFRIKPVRLLLLVAIIAVMALGYLPYWLGGGLIAAYFIIKWIIRAALYRLFTIPFKMKGKALAGATAEIHGWEWTEKPVRARPADEDDEDGEYDDEEDGDSDKGLRYVWIDVTITPPDRSEGFVHWDPSDLALIPSGERLKTPDDHDKCLQARDLRFIRDGQEVDYEGEKLTGPHRLKLLVAVPPDKSAFRFVYYFEVFGELSLT